MEIKREDQGLVDKLKSMTIEKYSHGSHFVCIAPTWLISDKVKLEDFLEDFLDPSKQSDSLRDFACMPSASTRPFFKDPLILYKNADPALVKPINTELGISDHFYPLSGVFYFFASDLSVSRDSCGIACVHRDFGFTEKKSTGAADRYVLDFSIQLKASRTDPIDYESIRNLIRFLKKRGFRFGKIGFDQFQSHDSALILAKEGYDVEIVKYADSLAGCGLVYDLVQTKGLLYGLCDDVFIGEAGELQVQNSRRIDHLSSGGIFNSKDVWDAVVNACVLASQNSAPFQREFLPTNK